MTSRNPVVAYRTASGGRAERALRELDDHLFSDVVLRELHRRTTFTTVAGQIAGVMKAVRAPEDGQRGPAAPALAGRAAVPDVIPGAMAQVPRVCSAEAGQILARRGVMSGSTPVDALRQFARDGRLIVLRGCRRWEYPRFQLDFFDPGDRDNIIAVVNRLLDAGHFPEPAASWWTSPSASLPGRRAPVELLGVDHDTLRRLAAAYAAGADL